jgi:hypothetical protein
MRRVLLKEFSFDLQRGRFDTVRPPHLRGYSALANLCAFFAEKYVTAWCRFSGSSPLFLIHVSSVRQLPL